MYLHEPLGSCGRDLLSQSPILWSPSPPEMMNLLFGVSVIWQLHWSNLGKAIRGKKKQMSLLSWAFSIWKTPFCFWVLFFSYTAFRSSFDTVIALSLSVKNKAEIQPYLIACFRAWAIGGVLSWSLLWKLSFLGEIIKAKLAMGWLCEQILYLLGFRQLLLNLVGREGLRTVLRYVLCSFGSVGELGCLRSFLVFSKLKSFFFNFLGLDKILSFLGETYETYTIYFIHRIWVLKRGLLLFGKFLGFAWWKSL